MPNSTIATSRIQIMQDNGLDTNYVELGIVHSQHNCMKIHTK